MESGHASCGPGSEEGAGSRLFAATPEPEGMSEEGAGRGGY